MADQTELATITNLYDADPSLLTEEEAEQYDAEYGITYDSDDEADFNANLAQFLNEQPLQQLAQNCIEWVEADKRSRLTWEEREARGIKLLGVTNATVGGAGFQGASRATAPGLAKSCIQFQARAVSELWPSGGPVKTIVLGDITPERELQAERVADFLNYQYETAMPGAFEEHDSLLFRLPMTGSCFKKIYFDPLENTVVSRFVESSDFYVPYSATDLRSAPRYTHLVKVVRNDLRKLISDGIYLDVVREEPEQESLDHEPIDDAINDAEGRSPTDNRGEHESEQDQRDALYECYCYLDLDDYQYSDPLASDGYGDPYVLTVHRDEQRVLSIRRNWKEDDPAKRRRLFFSHYKFLPGLGFYGFGFFHIAGGLSAAQTGALRALLDAATLANLKGGFRSRDLRLPKGEDTMEMGRWKEVDASAEEIARGFFTPPYTEPSQTLFNLLVYLDESMASLVSTTESMVGEENKAVPVGTTLARIEQGLKVFSGIHRRCHVAQKIEFSIVADLDAEYLPQEYPYDVPGESKAVMASDFDARVDVLPVSDPNIVTNTQRVVTAEAIWEKAQQAPDIIDRKAAARNYMEALRVQDVDEYVPKEDEIPRMEPIAEGQALLTGKPTQVYPDQDHQAHMAVHTALWESSPPEMQGQMQAAYIAHQSEHMAQLYRQQAMAAMGIELPQAGDEIPPEVEAGIAQQAAQAVTTSPIQLPSMLPQKATEDQRPTDMDDAKAAAEITRKDALANAEIERKNRQAQSDEERKLADSIAKDLLTGAAMDKAMKEAEYPKQSGGLSDAAAGFGQ